MLGPRTPLLRQGDMTDFFLSYIFVLSVKAPVFCLRRVFIACYRVSGYLFFFVSAGQHSKSPTCLGMGNKEIRGMYYRLCAVVCFMIFLLSLYFFISVATLFKNRLGLSLPRGLTTRRVTWLNLSSK